MARSTHRVEVRLNDGAVWVGPRERIPPPDARPAGEGFARAGWVTGGAIYRRTQSRPILTDAEDRILHFTAPVGDADAAGLPDNPIGSVDCALFVDGFNDTGTIVLRVPLANVACLGPSLRPGCLDFEAVFAAGPSDMLGA